jgi:hypothetical protein
MRVLDGDQCLVRIFLGESDQFHHAPLHRVLLERLRREGFAGATVIHGVAGFGANSVIHTASLVELSSDLPVLIEVVEDDAHVDRLLPILDEMVTGGALVTPGARRSATSGRRCTTCISGARRTTSP